jgi:hypothetical protein
MSNQLAYSPRALAKAFSPPLSERLVRAMIREGAFRPIMIGRRTYILHTEAEDALKELGQKTS